MKTLLLITTIILVRHGEKAGATGDVPLSPAGITRAAELTRVLTEANVAAIYTTPFLRTEQTAAPLGKALGIEPVVVDANKTYAHDVVEKIMRDHKGQTVLVVGHSNTTVDVLRELGVADPRAIADSEYDNLFVVSVADRAAPKVVAFRYGAAVH
jgi:2,3-bisphosphoglycerate-dependent phosphoglycerate mutase